MENKVLINELKKFNKIDLEMIICLNLLKIVRHPYFSVMIYLYPIEGANLTAIKKKVKNIHYREEKIKSLIINKLIDLELVEENDINDPSIFGLTDLGKKMVEIFQKFDLSLGEIPNFTIFLRNLDKIMLLSRLSYENKAVNYKILQKNYKYLSSGPKIRYNLTYFEKHNYAKKFNITKTYKITSLGEKIVNFYWSLYIFYINEYEKGVLSRKSRKTEIEFDAIWSNFFTKLDTFNMILLVNQVVLDNYQSLGNLRRFTKILSPKVNELLSILVNMKILEKDEGSIRNKTYILGPDFNFYYRLQDFCKNWKKKYKFDVEIGK
ncbi:MAG: hypothetical protein K9W44_04635 [Candidatus Lokiarchaeota archaeon]|nr:hypothetical protein [Candidatus Harpocratesius repetitus]